MPSDKKVRVAIVGLGFGAEFIPIYQAHPNAEMVAICRRNKAELDQCGDKFGVKVRYTDYDDLLMSGVDRDEARWRIEAQVEEILERWREPTA